MSIRDHLDSAAPLPWKAVRSARRWTKVVAADGTSFEDMDFLASHGIMLGVLQAMVPELVDYVERAADKGGKEAQELIRAFWAEVERLKDFP